MLRILAICLFIAVATSGCSPSYIINVAYDQANIMLNRKPIEIFILKESTNREVKDKLLLVRDARIFAKSLGLRVGKSYSTYVDIGRDTASWVVSASKPFEFKPYTWWFPFVGTVPYKGFLGDLESAKRLANKLKQKGYEVYIRGTVAFSSLGWFDDPVLSPMLRLSDVDLVQTLLHELVHSTVWFKSAVSFNESLAEFIGVEGAILYFKNRGDANNLKLALHSRDKYIALGRTINQLYERLDRLYSSDKTLEEKKKLKEKIFREEIDRLKTKFPDIKALKEPNNAEIMQFRLYLAYQPLFIKLFDQCGNDMRRFIREIKDFSKRNKRNISAKLQNNTDALANICGGAV